MVESSALLKRHTPKGYRGFESLPHRFHREAASNEPKATDSHPERLVSISLPEKYWVILLATLENHIATKAGPALRELQKQGDAYKGLPSEKITVLVWPIIARGMIVKDLAKAG